MRRLGFQNKTFSSLLETDYILWRDKCLIVRYIRRIMRRKQPHDETHRCKKYLYLNQINFKRFV